MTLLNSSRNPAFVDGRKLVMQGDTPLSSAGKIFVSAIRECCAERSYDAAGL